MKLGTGGTACPFASYKNNSPLAESSTACLTDHPHDQNNVFSMTNVAYFRQTEKPHLCRVRAAKREQCVRIDYHSQLSHVLLEMPDERLHVSPVCSGIEDDYHPTVDARRRYQPPLHDIAGTPLDLLHGGLRAYSL